MFSFVYFFFTFNFELNFFLFSLNNFWKYGHHPQIYSFLSNCSFMHIGYKSTSNVPLSFKPIPSNRQTVPNSRVPPKRSNSSVGKNNPFTTSSTGTASIAGMGTRSISVGTLNQAVSTRIYFLTKIGVKNQLSVFVKERLRCR